ncbi:MAG TPA: nucleotidyltransferase domain-containing protein, partial [Nitrospira sp.]|nr:nucleotidyltransferase domain-containing protein [Nitrospira sp.]
MPSGDWTIEGLPNETHTLLKRYIQDVVKAYGSELEGIVLFGSAVRGEFMPGRSNLNILLVMASYDLA